LTINQNSHPEKEANRLTGFWQKHGPNTYPLDLDALIDGVVLSAKSGSTLEVKRERFDSFEGCLVRTTGTNKWSILLNDRTENKRRQRFTFAHELGHYMCHTHLQDRFEDSTTSLNDFKSSIESEANLFASWLLMPANVLRQEFEQRQWTAEVLCEIGTRFECSLQASALRYVKLSTKPCAFVVSRDGFILWSIKSKSAPYLRAYCSGDELPEGSEASGTSSNGLLTTEPTQSGFSWSDAQCCKESQYFDHSANGYQYTCIDFTG
jgi:IrrE N-terminal-like domain